MKVLTIDLDYIMEPCIGLYNDLHYDQNPQTRWRSLFEKTAFTSNMFEINISNLMYCYNVFLKSIKNCEYVAFGYTHDDILHYIDDFKDIDLINIDHHCDFLQGCFTEEYQQNAPQKEIAEIIDSNRVNEGNWVAYLNCKNVLNSYTWIGNENSAIKWSNPFTASMIKNFTNLEKENYNFTDYNFDHIFVCLSPQYIPHKFWHYFSMFITVYEEFTGKDAKVNNLASQGFQESRRYSNLTDEIMRQYSTGR